MKLEDVIDPAKHKLRLVGGYATDVQGTVTVGGLLVPAFWMAHVEAQEHCPLWILMVDRPDAQSIAVVVGANGVPEPDEETVRNPLSGTVSSAPIGSDTVSVSTETGNVEAAFSAGYVPQVSDKVRLLWQDGNAWVLGKSAKVPAPAPPRPTKPKRDKPNVPAPPTGAGNGQTTFTASDSATWSTGTNSWNSYFGKDLYQGSFPGVGANRGAWFYHNKPSRIKGRTATQVEIWIPARARAGNYNSAVTLNVYLHYSAKRPGGDVNRGSHHTISIPKNFRGGWRKLPASWGDQLISGRGIGMAGGSYAGFHGTGKSSKSGQVRITWEK